MVKKLERQKNLQSMERRKLPGAEEDREIAELHDDVLPRAEVTLPPVQGSKSPRRIPLLPNDKAGLRQDGDICRPSGPQERCPHEIHATWLVDCASKRGVAHPLAKLFDGQIRVPDVRVAIALRLVADESFKQQQVSAPI
jgi:hypothetical protein